MQYIGALMMRNIKLSCYRFEYVSRKVCVVLILEQNKTTIRHINLSMKIKNQDNILAKDHKRNVWAVDIFSMLKYTISSYKAKQQFLVELIYHLKTPEK